MNSDIFELALWGRPAKNGHCTLSTPGYFQWVNLYPVWERAATVSASLDHAAVMCGKSNFPPGMMPLDGVVSLSLGWNTQETHTRVPLRKQQIKPRFAGTHCYAKRKGAMFERAEAERDLIAMARHKISVKNRSIPQSCLVGGFRTHESRGLLCFFLQLDSCSLHPLTNGKRRRRIECFLWLFTNIWCIFATYWTGATSLAHWLSSVNIQRISSPQN